MKTSGTPTRRGQATLLAGLLVLVLAALYMARAATGQVPQVVSYVVAALALFVMVCRLCRWR